MEQIQDIIDPVSAILWSRVLVYVLVGAGIWFTLRTRALQVRHFGHLFRLMMGSRRGASPARLIIA